MSSRFRAVLFDIGGVVVDSPLHEIARYERERGLPAGFINRVVVATGEEGAWARLERGELTLEAFCDRFDRECAAAGHPISARELMDRIAAVASRVRPAMLEAIRRIRAEGLRAAALTNNWPNPGSERSELLGLFDIVIESSVEGLRKPDPRIYRLACERLGFAPSEIVFLDDIGRNLKPARALGMHTIRVVDPKGAIEELERALGFSLGAER